MKTLRHLGTTLGALLLATSVLGGHLQPTHADSALLPSSITLTSNYMHPIPTGTALTLSGNVSPSDAFGLVVIADSYTDTTGFRGTKMIAEVHTLSRGHYQYTIPSFTSNGLSLGTNVLTAEYLGNATYIGSFSAPYTQVVIGGHW